MDATIQVQMLGSFTLRWGDTERPVSSRSRKLCLMLAYLICQRHRPVPYEELSQVLGEKKPGTPHSLSAIKALLHRARANLDGLEAHCGQPPILNRERFCQWNPDIPLTLDIETFSRLCQTAQEAQKEEVQLRLYWNALGLYHGDFLPTLQRSAWAAEQAESLHRQYHHAVLATLPQLAAIACWRETAQLSAAALALEPQDETLCRWQLEALLQLDRPQEAALAYEHFHQQLLAVEGVLPSDPLRDLYRKARQDQDPRSLTPDNLLERLQEPPCPGALLCDFDAFRAICYSAARMAGRSGAPVHLLLLSITAEKGEPLSRFSLDRAMDNLQGIILNCLRRGDAVARSSADQFVLLLPQASAENSNMIERRIRRAFTRQFPHSPAMLHSFVQPLPPNSGAEEESQLEP